jgi:hypothetical protein
MPRRCRCGRTLPKSRDGSKKNRLKIDPGKTRSARATASSVLCYVGCSIGAISCGRGPVFKMIGKHEPIILQKDFEHGRRYRHLFRSWVDFVESCCQNEGQHIFNSWAEKFSCSVKRRSTDRHFSAASRRFHLQPKPSAQVRVAILRSRQCHRTAVLHLRVSGLRVRLTMRG